MKKRVRAMKKGKKFFPLLSPKTRSIQFNIWLYFFFFSLLIILLVWLIEIVFIESFYTDMTMKQMKRSGDKIYETYGEENFGAILAQETLNSSITALIFSPDGNVISSSGDIFGSGGGLIKPEDLTNSEPIKAFLEQLRKSADPNRVEYREGEGTKHERFVYGMSKETDKGLVLFYFSCPITPLDITLKVLSQQLLIASGVLIFASFIVSWFISGKIGKPIISMSATAKKFAEGNYAVEFAENNYIEINELAQTLNFAVAEISKTDNLRKELVANVSHDLRTPLTMIKAYAEMTRDLPVDKTKRDKNLNVIIEESDRLSALVNDLLNLSRLQAGTEQLAAERCDVSKLTAAICGRFKGFCESKGYKIVTDIEKKLFAHADPSKLSQAVYNLIGNAINYTGKDNTVFVKLVADGEYIEFSVRDTGKGIGQEDLQFIWERYYRSNMHKRSVVGNGLGLSIVKNVLELHGAQYGADSELGKGSRFWFKLKKYEDNQSDEA